MSEVPVDHPESGASKLRRRHARAMLIGAAAIVVLAVIIRIGATGAWSQWRARRLTDAALARAVAQKNADYPVVVEMARRLERDGKLSAAVQAYQRACELDPVKVEAWTGWGRTCYAAGQWNTAERVLRKTTEQWPSSAEARFVLAALLARTFRTREARDELTVGLRHQAGMPEPWMSLGQLEMALGNPARAVAAYEHARSLAPGAAGVHGPYGTALLAAGRVQEAIKELDASLKEDPSDLDVRLQLGRALVTAKEGPDKERGLRELMRVSQFSADKAPAFVEAAQIWLRDGNRGDAIQALEHAVDSNPSNVAAVRLLADAYQEAGRGAEAAAFRQRLKPLEAESAERDRAKAAIQVGGDLAANLVRLGQLDVTLRDRAEAAAAYSAALAMDPGNPVAARALNKLTGKIAGAKGR